MGNSQSESIDSDADNFRKVRNKSKPQDGKCCEIRKPIEYQSNGTHTHDLSKMNNVRCHQVKSTQNIDITSIGDNPDFTTMDEKNQGIFTNFPQEIVLSVLHYLTLQDLVILSRVSVSFRTKWVLHPLLTPKSIDPFFELFISPEGNLTSKYFYFIDFVKQLKGMYRRKIISKDEQKKDIPIALTGWERCGKTAFCNAVAERSFSATYAQTFGIDMKLVGFSNVDGKTINLQLWELSGSPRVENIVQHYYGKKNIIFFYDISQNDSFDKMVKIVKRWMELENIGDFSNIHKKLLEENRSICIVGTKRDLVRQAAPEKVATLLNSIIPSEGVMLHDLRVQYFEISSKEQTGLLLPLFFIMSSNKIMF